MIAALGVIADLIQILGPVVKIGLWVALISAAVFGVIILRRLRFCHLCVVPFLSALWMAVVFGGFTAAQASVPAGEDRGTILALLYRIDATTQSTQQTVERTERRIEQMDERFQKYEALLDNLSDEKGVPKAAMLAHLEKLGATPDIDASDIPRFLERFSEEYLLVRQRLLTLDIEDEQLGAIRREAASALEQGDAQTARQVLRSARETIQRGREAAATKEALLLADEAGIDILDLEYDLGAEKLFDAADLVQFDRGAQASYLFRAGEALSEKGRERVDATALEEALATHRRVSALYDRSVEPHAWASSQINVANVLTILVVNDLGGATPGDVLAELEPALDRLDRSEAPFVWAVGQLALGNTYLLIGELDQDLAILGAARTAFQMAVNGFDRTETPIEWAKAQANLGSAASSIARLTGDAAEIRTALSALAEAQSVFSPARTPIEWADTKFFIGRALTTLAENEQGTENLVAAIAAFENALEHTTVEQRPAFWAEIQHAIGTSRVLLGQRSRSEEELAKAVAAFEQALLIRTEETTPGKWALSQIQLGQALLYLGAFTKEIADLERASSAYRAALSAGNVFVDENALFRTRYDLMLAESAIAHVKDSALAYRSLVTMIEDELSDIPGVDLDARNKLNVARLENSLCWHRALIIERSGDTSDFQKAVDACQRAIRQAELVPSAPEAAQASHSFAYLFMVTGEAERDADMIRRAISDFSLILADPDAARFGHVVEETERDLERAETILSGLD